MADLISRAAVLTLLRTEETWKGLIREVEDMPPADSLAIIEAAKSLRVAVVKRVRVVHAATGSGLGSWYFAGIPRTWHGRLDGKRVRMAFQDGFATAGAARRWVIAQLQAEGWTVVERKEGGG